MLFLILFLCTPPPSASRCHVTFRPRGQAVPVRGAGAGSGRRRGRPPLGQACRPPCRPRRVCSASARRAEPHARPLATRFSAQAWAWRSGAGSRVLCHPPERVPTPPGGWASAGSERVRLWALPACLAGERATVLPVPWGVLGAPKVPVAFPGGSAAAASTGDFPPRQGLSLSAVSGGRAPRTGERSPRGRLGWWPESVSQTRDRSLRALFLQTEPGRGLKRCPSTSSSPEQKRRGPRDQ